MSYVTSVPHFAASLLAIGLMAIIPEEIHTQTRLILHPGAAIATTAGNGADARSAAGPAKAASLGHPASIAYDSQGNLYLADPHNNVISRIDTSGNLTIVAGNGTQGFSGDNGPATAAQLNAPQALAIDSSNNLTIADTNNHRIRRVDSNGIITTIAGDGTAGTLRFPTAIALDAYRNTYIADTGNHKIRRLSPTGTLTTLAGTGEEGDSGDGASATTATLQQPTGLALLPDNRLLIADKAARRIRILNNDGTIGAFTTLPLRSPQSISTDSAGNIYITDAGNQSVQQATLDGVSIIAGNGEQGPLIPGATFSTPLNAPSATTSAANGNLSIADAHNHQIQTVSLPTIHFGQVPAGKASAAQVLTLENGGKSALQITAINLPAAFTQTGATTCTTPPFTLAAGATCNLNLAFAPTTQGPQTATAQIHILNAAPQAVLLTGTATPPASTTATSTNLMANGTITYAGSPITLTAAVTGSLSTPPTGNITFFDNTAPLATQNTSQPQFTTAALQLGAHTLHATYSGDASNAPSTSQNLTLTVVPAPDFALTTSATTYSTAANTTLSIPITTQPTNGTLNHAVTFAVTGLPSGTTANFLPAIITLGGDPVQATLTLKLPATLAQNSGTRPIALTLLLTAFTLTTALRRPRRASFLLLTFATTAFLTSCGGGFRGGTTTSTTTATQPHTYNLSITATTTGVLGDTLAHTTSITLVVTP